MWWIYPFVQGLVYIYTFSLVFNLLVWIISTEEFRNAIDGGLHYSPKWLMIQTIPFYNTYWTVMFLLGMIVSASAMYKVRFIRTVQVLPTILWDMDSKELLVCLPIFGTVYFSIK